MDINLCLTKHLVCEYFNIIYMYIIYEVYPWILGHIIVLGWVKREHMQTTSSFIPYTHSTFCGTLKCQKRWCEFALVMVFDKGITLHYFTCCFVFFALITLNKITCILEKKSKGLCSFIWYFPFDVYNVLFPIPIELVITKKVKMVIF